MPFPNKSFGTCVDPREAQKKSVAARGDKYKFLHQHKCTQDCPYFLKGCIYISLSKSISYHGKCAVKNLPDRQQQRVIRFLEGKNEDYIANMVELYQEIENSVKIRKDPALLMQAFDRLQKMYILLHGDKKQEETTVDMRELFDKMGEQLKTMEEKSKQEARQFNQDKIPQPEEKEQPQQIEEPIIKEGKEKSIPLEEDFNENDKTDT